MRLRTLNGAPLCEHLDFSPSALLDEEETANAVYGLSEYLSREDGSIPKWRRLVPKSARLQTGWSQPHLAQDALQFSMLNMDGVSELPEDTTIFNTVLEDSLPEMDGFAEHSLMFHETLVSSQIAARDAADRTVRSSSFLTSFDSTSSGIHTDTQTRGESQGPILQVPSTLTLSTLASLPSAKCLRAIYPQTPTPNILCVLTTMPEEREIFIKKGGYKMNLKEITVADDTKSSFKVTFWSRPRNDSQNVLTNTLNRLQVGDILLLRNIALNAFRDEVHGQSLNPSITRVKTSVEILRTGSGITSYRLAGLPAPVVAAFMRVKKWAKQHVASKVGNFNKRRRSNVSSSAAKRSRRDTQTQNETLPPDTMPPNTMET